MYIQEKQREYIHWQELENDAKGIRQTKNPGLSFPSSVWASAEWKLGRRDPGLSFSSYVCASADGSWGEGTLVYHSLAMCEYQLMEVGEKRPLVIIL